GWRAPRTRPGRSRGGAAPTPADRAPGPEVMKGWDAQVKESDGRDHRRPRDQRNPRAAFEDRYLLEGDTDYEVDLARPQRRGGGEWVLHDAALQRVKVGQPRLKIVRILDQQDVLAWDILLQHEGARADGMGGPVLAVLLERGRGDHRDTPEIARQRHQERPRGLFHAHAQRRGVHHLDLVDVLVVGPHPRFHLGVADAVDIPLR